MKKIYTLIALFCCLSAAQAQRIVDLQVTLPAPASGATITSGTQLTINGVIKNLSATALKATDTVLLGYTLDGSLISFTVNGQTVTTFYVTGKLLNQNDTLQYNRNLTFTFPSSVNGSHSFCLLAQPSNRSIDSVKDNVLTNNLGCSTVTFAGGTNTAVRTITGSVAVNAVTNVYPVPVSAIVSFDMNLGDNSPVTVKIVDLTGRVVLTEHRGMMAKGAQTITMNTSGLRSGIYLYQVIMDGDVSAGKLVISK